MKQTRRLLAPLSVLAAVAAAFLAASTAAAMMAPQYYRQARKDAQIHIQVAVEALDVSALKMTGYGECNVTGRIVRIFRDRTLTLRPGRHVNFDVDCARQSAVTPLSGTIYLPLKTLKGARVLEVYLNRQGGKLIVPLSQVSALPAPTHKAACPPMTEGARCP